MTVDQKRPGPIESSVAMCHGMPPVRLDSTIACPMTGTQTGAADLHENLKRKMCGSCSWLSWQDNAFHTDSISNWHGHRLADDSYEVIKD